MTDSEKIIALKKELHEQRLRFSEVRVQLTELLSESRRMAALIQDLENIFYWNSRETERLG